MYLHMDLRIHFLQDADAFVYTFYRYMRIGITAADEDGRAFEVTCIIPSVDLVADQSSGKCRNTAELLGMARNELQGQASALREAEEVRVLGRDALFSYFIQHFFQ